jgi:hypothetical protein
MIEHSTSDGARDGATTAAAAAAAARGADVRAASCTAASVSAGNTASAFACTTADAAAADDDDAAAADAAAAAAASPPLDEVRRWRSSPPLDRERLWRGVVLGAVYGAFAGIREAKELDDYRNSLNDHIEVLTAEVRGNRTKIDALTKALDARDAQAAAR